jgi:GT2 family glycosyltransferase
MIRDKNISSCDIIIPVWNQFELTKDCVENIMKNTGYPYRLIIIDNASDNTTRLYLEGLKKTASPELTLIRNEENIGFVKAVNQGLKVSDAPYVCVMNNDTIPAPHWLENMVEFAETHKDIGLVNPQCNGHLNTPIDIYARQLEKDKGVYMEMNQCQGFCMLIKRELIERIGYLDEEFGIGGFDDTDYSMRAHKAGYRCAAIKNAYVYHRLHASFDKSGDREDWVKRNQNIYYEKWGKHLRMGIAVSIDRLNKDRIGNIAELAYGLAVEWTWVHVWVNYRGDKEEIKKLIEDAMEERCLPTHQNIRVDYFSLPDMIFGLTLAGKLVERMRKRMRNKAFDTVVLIGMAGLSSVSSVAKTLGISVVNISEEEGIDDWRKRGADIALEAKARRNDYARSAM